MRGYVVGRFGTPAELVNLYAVAARHPELPCRTDPEAWTSKDHASRRTANAGCRACPILSVCEQVPANRLAASWLPGTTVAGTWLSEGDGKPGRQWHIRGVSSTNLRPCGTHAAYRRHLNRGEEPCEPCRQANAADDRKARAAARAAAARQPKPQPQHGTERAYRAHRRAGETPCPPCKAAHTERSRAYAAAAADRAAYLATLSSVTATAAAAWNVAEPVTVTTSTAYRVRILKACGTAAGYRRHRHRGETPCEACEQGKRADSREREQAKRDAAAARLRRWEAQHPCPSLGDAPTPSTRQRAAHAPTPLHPGTPPTEHTPPAVTGHTPRSRQAPRTGQAPRAGQQRPEQQQQGDTDAA